MAQLSNSFRTSSKIHCLIVGLGWLGQHMLRFLAMQRWYQTAGLVDLRPEILHQAGTNLGVSPELLFTDLSEALEKSGADVAIINTPSEYHYEQSKAALEAGLHVLMAKPITNDFAQAVQLVAMAKAKNLTLSVGQQVRYNRHYQSVRRFIESGRLGAIEAVFFLNSKPRPHAGNLANLEQPALIEMACHHFDSLAALFPNHIPEKISCDGFRPSWSSYKANCMVNATIEYNDNLHVLYHGGFSSQADMYELRLEGSKGALRCRGIHMSVDAMSYEFASVETRRWETVEIDDGIGGDDPFIPFLHAWHEYLQGGDEPPFSGRHNLRVYALLDAGTQSIVSGTPVAVAANQRYAAAFEGASA
jgi:predicted dehydrogenase